MIFRIAAKLQNKAIGQQKPRIWKKCLYLQAEIIEYMPKVFIYATAKVIWTFLFYGTDNNENRAHVHVGKAGIVDLGKIWLEPEVEVAEKGELTDKQMVQVVEVVKKYQKELLVQWAKFKAGEKVKSIKIKE